MIRLRRFVELIVNRIFRSRWGLGLLLAIMVLAVVWLGRVFSGPGTGTPVVARDTGTTRPTISTNPHGDDGVGSPPPPPPPSTRPGTAKPEAVAYAFASAWVDHRGVSAKEWYDKLLPHATSGLAERLSGVDPAGVPADRIVGKPTVIPHAASLVEATVGVDSGRLRLRLVAPDGRWLVDGVDWQRA